MATLVRTGGSRHTGQAALPHRNIQRIHITYLVYTELFTHSIAKANNLKPYDYFVYLLEKIPKHMEQKDRTFLEDLLPWSKKLPEGIRKQQ